MLPVIIQRVFLDDSSHDYQRPITCNDGPLVHGNLYEVRRYPLPIKAAISMGKRQPFGDTPLVGDQSSRPAASQ